jgi:hypothetical protein
VFTIVDDVSLFFGRLLGRKSAASGTAAEAAQLSAP